MTQLCSGDLDENSRMPTWVPKAARNYLEHVVEGTSIREIARKDNVHASTILRQVRRTESRRDDPLVDSALKALSSGDAGAGRVSADIEAELMDILRRLAESGALLAVARDMDMGVIVRDRKGAEPERTGSVERPIAEALALKGWIAAQEPEARVVRYRITSAGRAALREMLGAAENRAMARPGMAEARVPFEMAPQSALLRQARSTLPESPLAALARRRDRSGQLFLSRGQVRAGERLREDFELSGLAQKAEGWREDAGPFDPAQVPPPSDPRARQARERFDNALAALGTGLSDVCLRTCCLLEGLERTERELGWSARSGKIVLRIALIQLSMHYTATSGRLAPRVS